MFRDICMKDFKENVVELISREMMLITAGNREGLNTMTASWGFLGEMWGKDCAAVVVRPQRYTMEFLQKSEWFTLSFFGDNRQVHAVCGHKSGRDCDKIKEAGLTPVFDDRFTYFQEARLVLAVKKLYVQPMQPECFTDPMLEKWYPQKDFHNLIIGSIERMYVREKDPEETGR